MGQDAKRNRAASEPRPEAGPESSPLRVVIVDDTPDDRLLSIRQLRRDFASLETTEVVDEAELKAVLEQGSFDVVVTDYKIRWIDGLAVLARVKARYPDCPVIMFTATGNEEVAVRAMKASCDDYLIKSPRNYVRLPIAVRAAVERALARRRAASLEGALSHSQARWRSLVDAAPDHIITVDRDHKLTFANRVVTGDPVETVLGHDLTEFVARIHRDELTARVAAAFERETSEMELQASGANRTKAWYSVSIGPVVEDAEVTAVILISRDITAQKRIEAELEMIRERERERLAAENTYLAEQVSSGPRQIIGESEAFKKLMHTVEQVARTDATVLIQGNTGTGKELIAEALHSRSPRADKPLVKVNCAAISGGIAESELFGHEKGAFTGADKRRLGRFEVAEGGTIFLDEVGELTLAIQVKLLRVLQEHEFERVGSSTPIRTDVRVVAATNRDLAQMVEAGTFRQDLYYRLNVFPLEVPSLAERRSDIPLLVDYMLEKFAGRLRKSLEGVSREVLDAFNRYAWPGNIRELQNVVERAAIVASGPIVQATDIPPLSADLEPVAPAPAASLPATSSLEGVLRAHIERVLVEHEWVIEGPRGAATALDLNPNTLRSRMKKLGIRRPPEK
jgi:PAS domain S-box-containing protein